MNTFLQMWGPSVLTCIFTRLYVILYSVACFTVVFNSVSFVLDTFCCIMCRVVILHILNCGTEEYILRMQICLSTLRINSFALHVALHIIYLK